MSRSRCADTVLAHSFKKKKKTGAAIQLLQQVSAHWLQTVIYIQKEEEGPEVEEEEMEKHKDLEKKEEDKEEEKEVEKEKKRGEGLG